MKSQYCFRILLAIMVSIAVALPKGAGAQNRIKDIAGIQNTGGFALIGYGLVVGLSGTGDNIAQSPMTGQLLGQVGGLSPADSVQAARRAGGHDVAAVMVQGQAPAGGLIGAHFDVTVSAVGDARSLLGGTLVLTQLKGGDGQVWAVAQGRLIAGGFVARGESQSMSVGHATSGLVSDGATLERELPPLFQADSDQIRVQLHDPDFTTARRVADAINAFIGPQMAHMKDNAVITVKIPTGYPDGAAGLIAGIEGLEVSPDRGANRIVFDLRTGTVVTGSDIPVGPAVVSQGGLTIRVAGTAVVPGPRVEVSDGAGQIIATAPGSTVGSVMGLLNTSGLSAADQIAVLQGLRSAGAIHAELVTH